LIFVDTNVYFYARDDRLPAKQAPAALWLAELGRRGRGKANLQVANEFISAVLRRLPGSRAKEVFAMAQDILAWGNTGVTLATMREARQIHLRQGYSWWDCLLLASALELGCSHFLSEDLQDGRQIDNSDGRALTIVDPFAHTPDSILSPSS
jgi:predicted nucleic acid-binding protein